MLSLNKKKKKNKRFYFGGGGELRSTFSKELLSYTSFVNYIGFERAGKAVLAEREGRREEAAEKACREGESREEKERKMAGEKNRKQTMWNMPKSFDQG